MIIIYIQINNHFEELNKEQTWASDMLELLRNSIHQRKPISFAEIEVGSIKDRFDILLKKDLSALAPKYESLRKSLEKYREYIFTFLENPDVPYYSSSATRIGRNDRKNHVVDIES